MSGSENHSKGVSDNLQAAVEIQVPFHDVDLMGVVWHGHYVKYFEVARCALLDKLGYNYPQMKASGYAWPVVDMRVRYPGSAEFCETIVVNSRISEWENRLKIDYEIRNQQGRRLTRGYTVQVAVHIETGEMCFESPAILFHKLGVPLPNPGHGAES